MQRRFSIAPGRGGFRDPRRAAERRLYAARSRALHQLHGHGDEQWRFADFARSDSGDPPRRALPRESRRASGSRRETHRGVAAGRARHGLVRRGGRAHARNGGHRGRNRPGTHAAASGHDGPEERGHHAQVLAQWLRLRRADGRCDHRGGQDGSRTAGGDQRPHRDGRHARGPFQPQGRVAPRGSCADCQQGRYPRPRRLGGGFSGLPQSLRRPGSRPRRLQRRQDLPGPQEEDCSLATKSWFAPRSRTQPITMLSGGR